MCQSLELLVRELKARILGEAFDVSLDLLVQAADRHAIQSGQVGIVHPTPKLNEDRPFHALQRDEASRGHFAALGKPPRMHCSATAKNRATP
jgi:hypothetical protein